MKDLKILIIGGGIGGLTSAIALRRDGHKVIVIEKDPDWSVYGVGIIQQANVIRAMAELDLVDDYMAAGVPFNKVAIHAPDGTLVAEVPMPQLVEGYPASMGIGRPSLHKILGDRTISSGADVRLGVTAESIDDRGDDVQVTFSDGSEGVFDIVIGADGVYSDTRKAIMPDEAGPEFTGQAVWRYNFPRPADLDALHAYNGPIGAGLVPINEELMYLYLTTPEPENPWYPKEELAEAMRGKMRGHSAQDIRDMADAVTDNDGVVYRPLEGMMLRQDWHVGRVVLLGDAVHATTPHLGQGAGLAVEDSIVLAEEIARHDTPEEAFTAFRNRRFERCRYIVDKSLEICRGQLGQGPLVDNAKASAESLALMAQPI
ncbi:FAD-dependent oxidoreductase [Erythrobacter westpacificensis]|uniref:FAD-dependent oxidoreductase n=1 Tax=Erythrobacter westpacificensis TaxID=1055231 RepID=A0ABP9KNP2_9SPHN